MNRAIYARRRTMNGVFLTLIALQALLCQSARGVTA